MFDVRVITDDEGSEHHSSGTAPVSSKVPSRSHMTAFAGIGEESQGIPLASFESRFRRTERKCQSSSSVISFVLLDACMHPAHS